MASGVTGAVRRLVRSTQQKHRPAAIHSKLLVQYEDDWRQRRIINDIKLVHARFRSFRPVEDSFGAFTRAAPPGDAVRRCVTMR